MITIRSQTWQPTSLCVDACTSVFNSHPSQPQQTHTLRILSDFSKGWLALLAATCTFFFLLFKNNIPFQEFPLLPSQWCSELCPLGLSAERVLGGKMPEYVDLSMSLCSFHKWMTSWLDTAARVRPWSLKNPPDVNPETCGTDRGVENSLFPLPWLGKSFAKKFNMWMVFTY